ncbi:MAG: carboxylesterase family protein [Saprospiraceae bacterium]|nr:carboxylesterase family protein [Saprospiraceae bacterium]
MKARLIFLLCLLISHFNYAQNCDYTKEKFGFRSVKKIFVGTELDFQGNIDSLFLDIYYPVGSTEKLRPLVMWSFGGGFIAGKREDFAPICEAVAKRGFVAATIDYRIGFNGIQILPSDSAEVLRAGFRGIQDGKSALRYLKSRHVMDSIDLDRVWVGGGSAGAIVALGTAFYDKEEIKPKEAGSISAVNGQPRPDLGSIEGNRFMNNGYDTKVQGVFNIFGAVLNISVFDKSDNIAVFSYHQTEDPVVPCERRRAYWAYPIVTDYYPIAYGSCEIEKTLNDLNFNPAYHKAWIYKGNQHAVHNERDVVNFLINNANPILCNTVNVNDVVSDLKNAYVYPNPVTSEIFIEGINSLISYSIFNLQGNNIINSVIAPGQKLNVRELESGLYILQIRDNLETKNIKFTKLD